MRVLLVNKFHYRKGGAETYYLTVGSELERMGHEVAYFSMKHPNNLPCKWDKYFVTQREYNNVKNPFSAVRDGLALIYSHEAKRNFQALCEEFRPDVIHLNNVHRQITLSILDAPYLQDHHVPVVYTAHDYVTICPAYTMIDGNDAVCDRCINDGRYRHCLENTCVKGSKTKSALAAMEAFYLRSHGSYSKIDCVVAPSQFMHDKLVEGGWDSNKVVVLRNFATEDLLRRAGDNRLVANRASNPYILFFGRVSHEKGVEVLLAAFQRVYKRLPGWKLIVAGDGPEREDLESAVASYVKDGLIKFVGYKQGAELRGLVEGAAFAVSCSIWRENMPYAVIEALASGVPVIGSDIGGIPELVVEGETGFLCNAGSVESMVGAIGRAVEAFSNGIAYEQMIGRCKAEVICECSQTTYMNSLVCIYEGLING